MGYKDIKKLSKNLGIKLSEEGLEAHHLIEKRFAKKLGIEDTNEMLSVLLDKDVHRKITLELREMIGYNRDFMRDIRTGTANAQEIWDAIRTVYEKNGMVQYLEMIFEQIPQKMRADLCF